jgi:hypothetical protein
MRTRETNIKTLIAEDDIINNIAFLGENYIRPV